MDIGGGTSKRGLFLARCRKTGRYVLIYVTTKFCYLFRMRGSSELSSIVSQNDSRSVSLWAARELGPVIAYAAVTCMAIHSQNRQEVDNAFSRDARFKTPYHDVSIE